MRYWPVFLFAVGVGVGAVKLVIIWEDLQHRVAQLEDVSRYLHGHIIVPRGE